MAREQVGDVDQGAEPFNDSSKDPFGWYPEGSFLVSADCSSMAAAVFDVERKCAVKKFSSASKLVVQLC